ncbi:DEAD/DEAH box helicase [uncultured Prevotella sp.]|uniref:DEAD/DEAH box helicase n=1 Tax=uncultured Prevotella sp. TaxID=159272 RepID=UPI0027E2CF68|nr:DEAD/DEAH box helicase [uncultured Prevotella sp.]
MFFDETQLSDRVLDALYDMRFDKCTPIQEKCIPPILEGRDLLGVAQTGTGKTAAYLLPILSKLDEGNYPSDAINCVIMSPTRELAQQIDQQMQGFGYHLSGVSSVAVYGGNDGNRYDQELKSFQMGADVVIATPGRLISHISLGSADLSRVSFFVLDEADRMLDMGFSEDIKMIASKLPESCQTIMFSATMPEKIEELAKTLLKNPVEVKIAVNKPAEKIKQSAYVCYETQKIGIIKDLFAKGDLNRVIIFSGKKQKVKAINRTLMQMKINSGEMHSDLEQTERDEILYKFKTGQINVLVATDIVARGIDIDDIAMVINYDVPHDPEDYVHRIGRTARAERDGIAITFVGEDEIYSFKQIEKFLEREVEKATLPEGLGEGPDYNAPVGKSRSKGTRNGRGRKQGENRNGERNGRGRKQGEERNGERRRKKNNNGEAGAAGQNGENGQDLQNVQNQQNSQDNQLNSQDNQNQQEVQESTNPKPKRKRKPRRKPAANEGENGGANENGADIANEGSHEQKPKQERQPRERRQNKRKQGEGKYGERNSRRNNANRRNGRENRNDNKPETKATPNVPAVKQPSTLTQILKKPISWLKSIGKKK